MANFVKTRGHMTNPSSVSGYSVEQTEIGMAHFAATGDGPEKCRDCSQCRPKSKTSSKKYCHKYIELTGDDKKSITGLARSCRYFQPHLQQEAS